MDLNEKIKARRQQLGLTLEEVAKAVGVSPSSIQRYESGSIKNMRRDKIKKLSDILKCSPEYLMGWDTEKTFTSLDPFQYENILPIETKKFPLLGEIACGEPIFANEDRESYVLAGSGIKADFCLKAHGDSMKGARILDGDIVFIKQQDMVENGEIAAVIIGDTATLKRVFYYKDKNLLILKPENSSFDDQIYTNEELDQIKILGKAVAFQSDMI